MLFTQLCSTVTVDSPKFIDVIEKQTEQPGPTWPQLGPDLAQLERLEVLINDAELEMEFGQETMMRDEALKLVISTALTGEERHLEICRNSTLRDLQLALQNVFNIPPFEQILLQEDGDIVLGNDRFDDTRPVDSLSVLSSGTPLTIARKLDTRPQAEKNCAFLEALRKGKLDEAMNVLDSSGVAVDPNCVGSFCHEGPGFLSNAPGARFFGEIKTAKMPALCMAVMARCTWSPKGEVTGEFADDASVVRLVGRLLAMGASVDDLQNEVRTCGSWPDETVNKSALYLAVQTGSSALVRVLLDAGANPTKGCYTCQFSPGTSAPCESALTARRGRQQTENQHIRDDAIIEELRSLLRRKEYEVKISCADAPSSHMGLKVSRRDGYWGFIDEIKTDGLVATWNQHQTADRQVKVGDKIVEVCGHRAGIHCYKGTAWKVDEARGWTRESNDPQCDCFLAHLLTKPQDEMVLILNRTDDPQDKL